MGLDGGGVAFAIDGEICASEGLIFDVSRCGIPRRAGDGGREVEGVICAQGGVGRAGGV